MKKIVVFSLTLMCMMCNVVMAQSPAEIKSMEDRAIEITKKMGKQPKGTGNGDIDSYVAMVFVSAAATLKTSGQLIGIYNSEKKPGAPELAVLSKSITDQAKLIKESMGLASKATDAAKAEKNPALKGKMMKAVASATDLNSDLANESTTQLSVISSMMK